MKIYVTGGTGLVGSNLLRVAVERYKVNVFATVHRWQPKPFADCVYGVVDVHDQDQVLRSVNAFRPDAIVHCAAVLDLHRIYQDRALGWQSYVQSTRYLTRAANEVGAKLILISSDWVFDGTQTLADETTPPNPINYYGVLKVVGETLVAASGKNWAVARVAGVNGKNWARPKLTLSQNAGFGNLALAVANILHQNQPFALWQGDVNMRGNATLATEIGEMLLRIIDRDLSGIFHCCGEESATRLELAKATAQVFELDADLIQPSPPDPTDPNSLTGIPVPKDTSLDSSSTVRRLAYQPPGLVQSLKMLRQQLETGRIS
jgi:dTDP-4-dehydrorhamnose reductase